MSKDRRLYRRNGSKTWIAIWYELDGTKRWKSTRTSDWTAANAKLTEWERDSANPARAAARETTMSDALDLLIRTRTEEAAAGKKSADTVSFYKKKSGHLLRFFEYTTRGQAPDGSATFALRVNKIGEPQREAFLLSTLDACHVDDFITMRRQEGVGENSISKELVSLRAALKLVKRRGMWLGEIDAIMPVAFAPDYTPRARWLTTAELQKLLGQLPPDRAARVAFAVATSANWGETNRALRSHIAAGLGMVHIDGTKRASRKRDVPIVLPVGRDLLAYALKYGEGRNGKLFLPWGNVRRDLIDACARAEMPPCSTNDLRRTYSMWHQNAGASTALLFKNMGHASNRMLERGVYGQLAAEQRRVLLEKEMGLTPQTASDDCNAGATDDFGIKGLRGSFGLEAEMNSLISLPRDGIEPPTRGFSVPTALLPTPRRNGRSTLERQRSATNTQRGLEDEAPALSLAHSRKTH